MEEYVFNGELFNIYKPLLKESNLIYYSLYYEENLSLQEIADLKNVSKSYVGSIIKKTTKLLNYYEDNLHLYKLRLDLNNLLKENDLKVIKNKINDILNN